MPSSCAVHCTLLLPLRLHATLLCEHLKAYLPTSQHNSPSDKNNKIAYNYCHSLLVLAHFSFPLLCHLALCLSNVFPCRLCFKKSTGKNNKNGRTYNVLPFIVVHCSSQNCDLTSQGESNPPPSENECPQEERVHMHGQRPYAAHEAHTYCISLIQQLLFIACSFSTQPCHLGLRVSNLYPCELRHRKFTAHNNESCCRYYPLLPFCLLLSKEEINPSPSLE